MIVEQDATNAPFTISLWTGQPSFEDLGNPNWHQDVVRESFGYQSDSGFSKAMTRAKQACLALGLESEDHFVRQPDGNYVLTSFGCYLVAMNGDPRKPEVAAAQPYFAAIAETFQSHLEHADGIDRMGKEEMAAHLFRITQTDAKIKNENMRKKLKGASKQFKTLDGKSAKKK